MKLSSKLWMTLTILPSPRTIYQKNRIILRLVMDPQQLRWLIRKWRKNSQRKQPLHSKQYLINQLSLMLTFSSNWGLSIPLVKKKYFLRRSRLQDLVLLHVNIKNKLTFTPMKMKRISSSVWTLNPKRIRFSS